MQPAHLLTDVPLAESRWGRRSRGAYAFRSLLECGTTLVFGSDVPVASIDPREGVYAALERRGGDGLPAAGWYPDQKLKFEDAVRAYSAAAAAAGGTAARRGTLEPGKDADFVAWLVDPAIEQDVGDAFRSAQAVMTVVGGRIVMQA
jgi:predicted amidohydrolase YtcJ